MSSLENFEESHHITYYIAYLIIPQFRESIDNDTKNDVQSDGCDQYKECDIQN